MLDNIKEIDEKVQKTYDCIKTMLGHLDDVIIEIGQNKDQLVRPENVLSSLHLARNDLENELKKFDPDFVLSDLNVLNC